MNLLVFDIDGTLLNTTDVDTECYQKALQKTFDISIDSFDWEDFTHVTDQGVTEDILKNHFGRMPMPSEMRSVEEAMTYFVKDKRATHPESFLPAEGIMKLLNELENQTDIGFVLATGAWEGSALTKLTSLPQLDMNSIPWEHAGPLKRREDIVNSAVRKGENHYRVQGFEKICALGDGKWDKLTAEDLSLNFVGVDLLKTNRLKELGTEQIIEKYPDLETLKALAF